MKKIKYILVVIFVVLSTYSCTEDPQIPGSYNQDSAVPQDEEYYEDVFYPEEISYTALADFSATQYPSSDNTWTIYDSYASTSDFAGLSAAIAAISDSGRSISLVFPNLTSIPSYAIFGVSSSSSVYASDALYSVSADVATSIGSDAFYSCKSLKSISFPKATTINSNAFYNCSSLTSVYVPLVTVIYSSAFRSCAFTTLSLPALKTIDDYVFRYCYNLTSISINSAVSIGSYSFESCSSLKTINLPKTTTISSCAFRYCSSLESVSAPYVTELNSYVFGFCTSLTSLSIANYKVVTSMSSTALNSVTTTNLSLTLSNANNEYIDFSTNSFTYGTFSMTFNKITFCDGDPVDNNISDIVVTEDMFNDLDAVEL